MNFTSGDPLGLHDSIESLPPYRVKEFQPFERKRGDRWLFRANVARASLATASWLVANYVFERIAPDIAQLF